MHVYVCIFIYINIHAYVNVHMCVSSWMPCRFKYVCICMCLYVYEHTCVCKHICVCGGAVCMYAYFIALLGFPENSSCRTLWVDPKARVLLSLLLLCCLSLPGSLQLDLQLKSCCCTSAGLAEARLGCSGLTAPATLFFQSVRPMRHGGRRWRLQWESE